MTDRNQEKSDRSQTAGRDQQLEQACRDTFEQSAMTDGFRYDYDDSSDSALD